MGQFRDSAWTKAERASGFWERLGNVHRRHAGRYTWVLANGMNRLARRFLFIGAAILGTLVTGTVGFTLIDHYPPFDAFYMTLITMTTVGYGEVHPLSQAGRVFNSFLIMFGVTTIFIAIGAMTQTIIELEFGDVFNKRRSKRMIERLNNHHIICGFGRVGRGAAAELQRAGAPFVIVDSDPARAERAMMSGMLAVAADATHDDSLRQVGVDRARGLVAALATDADNLFVLLSAKALNPDLYVAVRAAEEGAVEKMRRAGASSVIAPYALTGHRLAQSLLRPHVVQFLDFATNDVGEETAIEQVLVAEHCEMVGKTIREMQLGRNLGVIVMAIRDCHGKMHVNPPADAPIQAGDTLIAMGGQQGLRSLEVLLAEPPHTGRR